MSRLADQRYLVSQQYRTPANLEARIALHQRFSTNRGSWFHWLIDRMGLPPRAKILEVGSGTGLFWRENADRLAPDWEIILTDLSEGMLAESRVNLTELEGRFSWQLADAQELPFGDDSFDVVIANHMLYHVPDRPKALAEIRRVLQPGGHLYAATNGRAHLAELRELIDRFAPGAAMWAGTRPEREFGLESGREQLAAFFAEVTVHRHPNALEVTEVEPLVAYIRSLSTASELSNDQLTVLREHLERELAVHGSFHITSDSGLLVAS